MLTQAESTKRDLAPLAILGLIDGLGIGFHGVVVALAYLLHNIAHLVDPAALVQHPGIDRLDGGPPARTTIGHDHLQLVALQSPAIEIVQQPFPVCLALSLGTQKGQQFPAAIGLHP